MSKYTLISYCTILSELPVKTVDEHVDVLWKRGKIVSGTEWHKSDFCLSASACLHKGWAPRTKTVDSSVTSEQSPQQREWNRLIFQYDQFIKHLFNKQTLKLQNMTSSTTLSAATCRPLLFHIQCDFHSHFMLKCWKLTRITLQSWRKIPSQRSHVYF